MNTAHLFLLKRNARINPRTVVMISAADLIAELLVALAVLFGGYAVWVAGMIFIIKAMLRNHRKWLAGFFLIALIGGLLRFLVMLVTGLSG